MVLSFCWVLVTKGAFLAGRYLGLFINEDDASSADNQVSTRSLPLNAQAQPPSP